MVHAPGADAEDDRALRCSAAVKGGLHRFRVHLQHIGQLTFDYDDGRLPTKHAVDFGFDDHPCCRRKISGRDDPAVKGGGWGQGRLGGNRGLQSTEHENQPTQSQSKES